MRRRGPVILMLAGLLAATVVVALAGRAARADTLPDPGPRGTLSTQMSSAHFRVDWDVIGCGGGTASSTHFILRSTIGQRFAVDDWSTGTYFGGRAGFWQTFRYSSYLPLLLRNY
jgi:hypothetical protein